MTATGREAGRRVIVTGASGCIGRQLVPLLVSRGWEVHAVSSRGDRAEPGVQWHRFDLLDPIGPGELLAALRPEALVHLAWYVAPGRWATAVENLEWVRASVALAQAFARTGGRRLVVAGSCLEYDWRYGYCSEDLTPRAPHTLYGIAKHALHLLLEGLAARVDLDLAWARIFFVFGPGEHPDRLIPSVVRALLRGERAKCSHGRQVRDYLFAGDVADALVTLLEQGFRGTVNVASGEPISVKELASRAAQLCGGRDLVDFGAVSAAPTDVPLVVADVGRLQGAVGWRPRWTLDDALRETVEWWRAVEGVGPV